MKKIKNIGLLTLCCLVVLVTLITILIKPYTYNESGSLNNDTNSYSNNLDTTNLSISNVTITSNSSYTICSGTLSVKSYSPYRYHYIKVKGVFKNSYGSTVDTDWTYAIGSEWLEPGESTKFRLSVQKDYSIKDCSVTIMTY